MSVKTKRMCAKGITLIELLVAMAIVAIIVAIAYPSYSSYVLKTHRTAAKTKLLEIMDKQQNYYVRQMTYTKNLTDLGYKTDPVITDNQRYSISAGNCKAPLSESIATCVTLTAKAMGEQTGDGDLVLNSAGGKSPEGKW